LLTPQSARTAIRVPALAFLLTLLVAAAILSTASNLYDGDSYYHLAVAREYWKGSLRDGLPWSRLSIMREGFGDKELLFHFLLMPFARDAHSSAPGRVAVAVMVALAAAAIAALAQRVVGNWAVVVPLGLFLGSADLASRLFRLRPESLSLVYMLAAVLLAAQRRFRLLGVVAAAYVLSHTSFHLMLVLCGAWLLHDAVRRGRWDWDILAYPILGASAAMLVHPHFPANVRTWWLQNITRYAQPLPDAGGEFQVTTVADALSLNGAWIVSLLLLHATRRRRPDPLPDMETRAAGYLLVAATVCGALMAFLPRFALYFVPLATLAFLFETRRRGFDFSSRFQHPALRRVPLALALAVLAGPLVVRNALVIRYNLIVQSVLLTDREKDARAFAAKIPAAAKVAAPWSETAYYVFWAPQGLYLNVLDPIFMAAAHPRAYETQLALFDGREPDAPLATATALDSDFIAMTRLGARPLALRLAADPRVERRHEGYDALYAIHPDANQGFVLDWRVSPTGALPATAADLQAWPPYPLATTRRGREVEGFVDGRRLPGGGCLVFSRLEAASEPRPRLYEFAPQGASALFIDGRPLVTILGEPTAILGKGVAVPIALSPGIHLVSVRTCPAGGYAGFYLLSRAGPSPWIRR
jgi:hypothetical protein